MLEMTTIIYRMIYFANYPYFLSYPQTSKKVRRHSLCRSLIVEHTPSPGQLLELVFDPPSLAAAWEALKYAEAAKYHGNYYL